jgi:hypothetical protein
LSTTSDEKKEDKIIHDAVASKYDGHMQIIQKMEPNDNNTEKRERMFDEVTTVSCNPVDLLLISSI